MYIGEKETKWLFVILITSRIFVGGINVFAEMSGVSGTLFALLCSAFVFLYFWCVGRIKSFSDLGFFDIMRKSYGKCFSVFIGTVLATFSLFNSIARLRMFLVAVTDVILPDSPVSYVAIFFALAVFAVSFFGMEAITRYAVPAGIVIAASVIITCVLNLKSYSVSNIYPLFDNEFNVSNKVTEGITMFSDVFYLYFISDFFKEKYAKKRVALKAIAISGIIITILVFLYTLAVPYPASATFSYPFFRFTSLANTSVIFQRLDAVVYIIWLFSGFLSAGALALFTMMIFSECFGMSYYKGIMHVTIFLIISIALSGKNYFVPMTSVFSIAVFIFVPVTALIYRLKVLSRRGNYET